MDVLEGQEKCHTRRGTFCVWGGLPYGSIHLWKVHRFVKRLKCCEHLYTFRKAQKSTTPSVVLFEFRMELLMGLYICERFADLAKLSNSGNIYAQFGRPRKVPHQALWSIHLWNSSLICGFQLLTTHMLILEGPEKYHTKRRTFLCLGWNPLWVYIFVKELADLLNLLHFVNLYAQVRRPRKVPYQVRYSLCLGWIDLWSCTFTTEFIDLWTL